MAREIRLIYESADQTIELRRSISPETHEDEDVAWLRELGDMFGSMLTKVDPARMCHVVARVVRLAIQADLERDYGNDGGFFGELRSHVEAMDDAAYEIHKMWLEHDSAMFPPALSDSEPASQ